MWCEVERAHVRTTLSTADYKREVSQTNTMLVKTLVASVPVCVMLPWMGWGLEHSPGHYVDLLGAVLGVTLFPVGYLVDALARRYVRG